MACSRALVLFVLLTVPVGALAAPATVVVFEAEVHAAPDASSAVIATLPEDTRVAVSETVTRGFRKVRLQNGRVGYVADSAIALLRTTAPPAQVVRPQAPQAAPPGEPPPPVYQPPPPPAPPPPPYAYMRPVPDVDPTAFRHVGLFVRAELGLGYSNSSTAGRTLFGFDRAYGAAGGVAFALGGALKENYILAAEFWASWLPSPNLKSNGASVWSGDLSTALLGIGPNFTWFVTPANVSFSFTPSVTWVNLNDYYGGYYSDYYDGYTTHVGVGARFALAKNWWLGPHWGLGLSGWFALSFNREGGGADATWRTYTGGVALSTSFN